LPVNLDICETKIDALDVPVTGKDMGDLPPTYSIYKEVNSLLRTLHLERATRTLKTNI